MKRASRSYEEKKFSARFEFFFILSSLNGNGFVKSYSKISLYMFDIKLSEVVLNGNLVKGYLCF